MVIELHGGARQSAVVKSRAVQPLVTLCGLALAGLVVEAADSRAPAFVSQPQSIAIRVGGTVRLDAAVSGARPMAFNWLKDGIFLGGATNVPLVISNAPASASGVYALIVVNDFGAARGSNATVFVDTNQPCNFPWRWEARLHGTNFGPYGIALDVAIDQEGNTFAVGFLTSSGNGYDWIAAKFDRKGERVWLAQYDGPNHSEDLAAAVALDPAGNCYVTGISSGLQGTDYLTIKYDREGNERWRALHNIGQTIAVDSLGNAYVGGNQGVLRFDPNGVPLWTNSASVDILKLTPDGSALYTLSCYGGGLTRLNTNGSLLWQAPIPCALVTPGSTQPKLAVDAQGNAYVAGSSDFNYGAARGDIETVKFDRDGNRVWTSVYNSTAKFWTVDAPGGIQVDGSGYVYVVGSSLASDSTNTGGPDNPKTDIILLKYDPQGQLLWATRYNGPDDREDYPLDLQVDAVGGVYVCGYSSRTNPVDPAGGTFTSDGIVLKYDSSGNELWVSRYLSSTSGGIYRGSGYLRKLALDAEGNLAAVGEAPPRNGRPPLPDFLVLKFDQRGPFLAPHGFPSPDLFQCCLVSPQGSRFDVQATSDFENWQPVATVTNVNGLSSIFDFEAKDHPQRFYRATRLEP
jgi:hypothetical protein